MSISTASPASIACRASAGSTRRSLARASLSSSSTVFRIRRDNSAVLLAVLASAATLQPAIVQRPIPFPAKRRAETTAYAQRHYGLNTWRLQRPHVIVEHVTASTTFSSAWSTFAADVPDAELHELPGTCSHFVVDTDGTTYQVVPLGTICRHTVGLNYTAIGIEHVGLSQQQVLDNPAQMRASLALTGWLRCRYRIGISDVI